MTSYATTGREMIRPGGGGQSTTPFDPTKLSPEQQSRLRVGSQVIDSPGVTPGVFRTGTEPGGGGPNIQPAQPGAGGAGAPQMTGTTATQINPLDSLRQQTLNYDPVASNISPGSIDVSGFNIDPGSFKANAQTASAGERLAFKIDPGSVLQQGMAAFRSQLPQMDIEFADASDQLARRTAAMGRTGSGLFNQDTGHISDRARAQREGMLGNLSFDASKADQSASLQAQVESNRLREQQQGRFANTNVANMQSANMLAGQGAQNALQASLGNQRTGADAATQNVWNDFLAQQTNTQNQIDQNQFGANIAVGQQGRQDGLANQSMANLYQQLGLLGQGFQGDPGQLQLGGAGGVGTVGGQYGANAAASNANNAALWQSIMQGWS